MARPKPKKEFQLTVADVYSATGLRPLTSTEKKRLGIKTTTRAFTTQKEGVKKLIKAKVVSRRQAEQRALEIKYNQKITLERKARSNFLNAGGRRANERYEQLRTQYIKNTYHGPSNPFAKKRAGRYIASHPAKVSQVATDKEFKALYRAATKPLGPRATLAQKAEKFRALSLFYAGEEAEKLRDLYERYVTS